METFDSDSKESTPTQFMSDNGNPTPPTSNRMPLPNGKKTKGLFSFENTNVYVDFRPSKDQDGVHWQQIETLHNIQQKKDWNHEEGS